LYAPEVVNAAKALEAAGEIPPGVDKPELYRVRSGFALLPAGANGHEVLADVHFCRSEGVEVATAIKARS
jgi:hypothetical protein